MSKSDLTQYQERKRLMDTYQAELDGDLVLADTVVGSMQDVPYIARVIPIRGRDIHREQYLRQRIYTLGAQCARAEAFVAAVADEQMRALLYWHYIQGMSWPKVRKTLRERRLTTDALKKRAYKFLSTH